MKREPWKHGARLWMPSYLGTFGTVVVTEKCDALIVDSASKNDPPIGKAIGIDGADDHRMRLRQTGRFGIGVPDVPLLDRRGCEISNVESIRFVLHSPMANTHESQCLSLEPMDSAPRMYGLNASGIVTEPSGW